MTVTIGEVLDQLRTSALDKRDQGDKFERLILNFIRTDPEWVARFSDVWLWQDWPERGTRTDTGIDLVARYRDQDGLAAIQCKFYDPAHKASKADLDTFLSASGGEQFLARYPFDTSDSWSSNAVDTAQHQAVPVQRIDLSYLGDAALDWSQHEWSTPEVLVPLGRKQLRPHQRRALEDVQRGLALADRGKLVMACGTGKTFTSLKIAEELVGARCRTPHDPRRGRLPSARPTLEIRQRGAER